jgi:hypothetical protein
MYNPATQVQVPTDANLGSYFQKTKIAVGASPTAFPFKKNLSYKNANQQSYPQTVQQNYAQTTQQNFRPQGNMQHPQQHHQANQQNASSSNS